MPSSPTGHGRAWRAVRIAGLLPLSLALTLGQVLAADDQYLHVTIGSGQTIRDLAEKYLADPDLWPEILKTSGIKSITDLHPGMEVMIPVTEISAANDALIQSLGQIQKANLAGAQIFAPDEINKAIDLHEQALQKRIERAWAATKDLAAAAFGAATDAITESESRRDQAAEALVSDRKGAVEGQRPEDLSWRDLALRTILIEEEKVRTLSDSTAQITFRDASRLRLNSNSNAVITEMRFDPLKRTEEAKVSLVQGDFYALLAGADDRKKFNVEIPQVNATIDSGDFWVSNKDNTAKFTNYDDKTVNVAAAGGTVTLGKNEGTVVGKGEKPMQKTAVLPPPTPTTPADNGVVYVVTPELSWQPVDKSAGYWLEVASDQRFDHVVANHFGIDAPQQTLAALPIGEYFWRVSALDQFGLPGARSDIRRFTITPDTTPPYLTIEKPAPGTILRSASLDVSGESEAGATLAIDGAPITIGADGKFATTVTLKDGDNTITALATDPAGNKTTREVKVAFMPDAQSVVAFDPSLKQLAPKHFITNANVLSLSGKTTPDSTIEIRADANVLASAVSDHGGVFRINVPLTADEEKLGFAVIAPSGFTSVEDFEVTVDRTPPEVVLDELLPQMTATAKLSVLGHTEPGASLTVNGQSVELTDGRFARDVTLQPGENLIELTATDPAGNVTIEKSEVTLDQDPPELLGYKAEPATNGGKQVLSVEVDATDASGLAKAAPFTVFAGNDKFSGYLRYNKASKSYQGFVYIPEDEIAGARLGQITLEDNAGNSKTFDNPKPSNAL